MKISIVMAAYNAEDYLEECVRSILEQTYPNFEFIIVNDGSEDRTKEILDKIADPRVEVIHLKKNQGAANALNRGIKSANGDWIAIHDADDISLPHRIEEQVKFIRTHSDVVAVGSLIECIPGHTPVSDHTLMKESRYRNKYKTRKELRKELFHGCPVCHGSVMFSKAAFYKAGGYDTQYKIAYDWDLWMRLLEAGPIAKVKKILYQYRIEPNSLSHRKLVDTCNEANLVITRAIHRQCYGNNDRNHCFYVFGPKRGCVNFKELMDARGSIEVKSISSSTKKVNLEAAYHGFLRGKADGIIVLYGLNLGKTLKFFRRKGMKLNRNLFKIWNVLR